MSQGRLASHRGRAGVTRATRRWRPSLSWIGAAALWAFAGCSGPDTASPAQLQVGGPVRVITAAATMKPIGLEIEAVGTTRANESVEITSKASNTIIAIHFEEGATVERGAVLVEMDGAQAEAALAEAQAAVADSRSQFTRSRELASRQALSISQLEQIEARLKADEARVAAAQARLADTVIRASFTGRTGFRQVSVGSFVSPGTLITTLDDTSIIKLDFTVPETYLFVLERGLPVIASTTGLPDEKFIGVVTNIESRVDPVTRSITVRAELPNERDLLRQGMFMTVMLRGEVEPTLMVPEQAIVPERGRTYAFVVASGRVERREVHIGKRRPGEVEIVEGLRELERVVVDGTQNVRDGTAVEEIKSDPS